VNTAGGGGNTTGDLAGWQSVSFKPVFVLFQVKGYGGVSSFTFTASNAFSAGLRYQTRLAAWGCRRRGGNSFPIHPALFVGHIPHHPFRPQHDHGAGLHETL
jgi:hypothetical protein